MRRPKASTPDTPDFSPEAAEERIATMAEQLTFTVRLHSEDREIQAIEVINAVLGDTDRNPGLGLDNGSRWRVLRWAADRYRLPETRSTPLAPPLSLRGE